MPIVRYYGAIVVARGLSVNYMQTIEAVARRYDHGNHQDFVEKNFRDWKRFQIGSHEMDVVLYDPTSPDEYLELLQGYQRVEREFHHLGIAELDSLNECADKLWHLGVRHIYAMDDNSLKLPYKLAHEDIDGGHRAELKVPFIPCLELNPSHRGLHLHMDMGTLRHRKDYFVVAPKKS